MTKVLEIEREVALSRDAIHFQDILVNFSGGRPRSGRRGHQVPSDDQLNVRVLQSAERLVVLQGPLVADDGVHFFQPAHPGQRGDTELGRVRPRAFRAEPGT